MQTRVATSVPCTLHIRPFTAVCTAPAARSRRAVAPCRCSPTTTAQKTARVQVPNPPAQAGHSETRIQPEPQQQHVPLSKQQQEALLPQPTQNVPSATDSSSLSVLENWADNYQMPDEMSLWDDDGDYYSSRRDLSLAYLPPKSDLPGFAAAASLLFCWAAMFQHALWGYDLSAPLSVGHVLDGLFTFASLEFLSTGLFITTHDSMHGAVTPNNRLLNDVIGSLCVSLYAWFDYSKMWTKHWEHHNLCGQPKEDPDFHKGDPALHSWFLNFMKGYISLPQFAKLMIITTALAFWAGAPIPNQLLFWLGSGGLSAMRLFYFGTYVPHKPRKGGTEVMAWAKARSDKGPTLLSFLQCYNFGMHWEHHRWPFAPWWDLPRARAVRYAAMGSLDD